MKGSHFLLIVIGLAAQTFGWGLAPRRWKTVLAALGLGLDAVWGVWYFIDDRSLSVSGFWSLSPVATWLCFHCILVPILGVEGVARILGRWKTGVRLVGIGLLLGGYGWGLGEAYGPPAISPVSLAFPDLPPAFEGYRIVLMSDIHAGPYAGTRTLGRWARGDLDAVRAERDRWEKAEGPKQPERMRPLSPALRRRWKAAKRGRPPKAPGTKAVPTMITLDPALLKKIDSRARTTGMSRSQFLAHAARHELCLAG